MTRGKRIYVLDTNVLMHDPTALFKFEEHDIYLPMQVIEELDNGKKGTSEASRNARQVSRFLNELVQESGLDNLADGIPLQRPNGLQLRGKQSAGKLRFQTSHFDAGKSFGKVIPDNAILGAILALKEETPDLPVVFVSRTSTCGSRPPSPASCPRTTRTIARWTISAALHRRYRAAGRLLETPRRRPAQLERQGPLALRNPGAGRRGVVSEPVRLPAGRG